MQVNHLNRQQIEARLAALPAQPPYNHFGDDFFSKPHRSAAVLMPLLCIEDRWNLLFIRRTIVEGDLHSGQVAFPGGRMDPEDADVRQTALRETQEELGIVPSDIDILGQLNDVIVISNYRVTPIVGTFNWPYPIHPQTSEVSRVFTIPLDWLADPANREVRWRTLPDGTDIDVIYFKKYDGEQLWGASARFMLDFLNALEL